MQFKKEKIHIHLNDEQMPDNWVCVRACLCDDGVLCCFHFFIWTFKQHRKRRHTTHTRNNNEAHIICQTYRIMQRRQQSRI